jgi:hypothetical protein
MNRDDDSFLSAYLDGELDPDERPLVESALVSDPELAEKLRGLGSLRDLLSSLNRDYPVDVASRVMHQMRVQRRAESGTRLRHVWLRAAKFSPRAALVAGIAATLLLAVTLALPLLVHRSGSGRNGILAERGSALPPSRSGPSAESGLRPEDVDLNPAGAGRAIEAVTGAAAESGLGDAGRKARVGASHGTRLTKKSGALEHYRQLLDNPNQRRLFRISDDADGKVVQQVASVVASSTQFDFYKVTIAQGIVIDPRHPGEATVYAAIVTGKGLDALRDRLAKAVPDRVEESQVDPAVVTQLADLGQVSAFRSVPFGDVQIPREIMAFQRAPGDASEEESAARVDERSPGPDQPTIEQYRSAPIGELVAQRLTSPARAGTSREPAEAVESGANPAAKARADRGAPAEAPPRDSAVPAPAAPAIGSRRRDATADTFVVLVWVERSRRG